MRRDETRGRKPLVESEETLRTTICWTESQLERAEKRAVKEISFRTGRPKALSEFIRDAVDYYLDDLEQAQKGRQS